MAGRRAGLPSICQSSRFRNNQRGKLVSDLARLLRNERRRCVGLFNYIRCQTNAVRSIFYAVYVKPIQREGFKIDFTEKLRRLSFWML